MRNIHDKLSKALLRIVCTLEKYEIQQKKCNSGVESRSWRLESDSNGNKRYFYPIDPNENALTWFLFHTVTCMLWWRIDIYLCTPFLGISSIGKDVGERTCRSPVAIISVQLSFSIVKDRRNKLTFQEVGVTVPQYSFHE